MTERFCSDFLTSDGSFLSGAASAFSIGGRFFKFNLSATPARADVRAVRQDFAMVGQDIGDVAEKLEQQHRQQLKLAL